MSSGLEALENLAPAELLVKLDEGWTEPTGETVRRLPLYALRVLPQVFQLRASEEPNADHVERLRRAIRDQGALDPIEVVPALGQFFVVDGHHRVEAYRQAGWGAELVPVWVLREKPSRAVLRAGKANSRVRLQMTEWERSEAAWKLVNLGAAGGGITYSKAEIARAASVSDRTVGKMRQVRRELAQRHPDVDPSEMPWLEAKALAEGRIGDWHPLTEDEMEKLAEDYARRMQKHLGPRFARNPEIAAKAIVKLAPRGALAIAQAVLEEVGAEESEEDNIGEDF